MYVVCTYVLFVEKVSGKNVEAALINIIIITAINIYLAIPIAVDNKIKG